MTPFRPSLSGPFHCFWLVSLLLVVLMTAGGGIPVPLAIHCSNRRCILVNKFSWFDVKTDHCIWRVVFSLSLPSLVSWTWLCRSHDDISQFWLDLLPFLASSTHFWPPNYPSFLARQHCWSLPFHKWVAFSIKDFTYTFEVCSCLCFSVSVGNWFPFRFFT